VFLQGVPAAGQSMATGQPTLASLLRCGVEAEQTERKIIENKSGLAANHFVLFAILKV
jgi:hypothetical protein